MGIRSSRLRVPDPITIGCANPDLMMGCDRGENVAPREVKLAGLMLCRIFVCRTGIQRETSLRTHSENVRGEKMNKPLNSIKEGNLSSYFRYYTRMEFLDPLGVSGGHSTVILSVWTSSREEQRTKISMSHPQLWAGRDKSKCKNVVQCNKPTPTSKPSHLWPLSSHSPKGNLRLGRFSLMIDAPCSVTRSTGHWRVCKTERVGMDAFINCCKTRLRGDFWPRHGLSARGLSLTAVDTSEFWCCVHSFQATHSLFSCSPASIQRKVAERHLAR